MKNLTRLFFVLLAGFPWLFLATSAATPASVTGSGSTGTANNPINAWSSEDYDFYAGDFNGDGFTDVLFIAHSPSMPSGILLSDGTAPTILGQIWSSNYLGIPWSSDAYTVLVGDFNGDGKADIFLQSNGPADSYLLLTDSSGSVSAISQTVPVGAMGLDWSFDQHHLVVGDFNGDGHADLFFQPTVPGGISAVVYSDQNGQFTSQAPAQTWSDGYLGFNWSVQDANVFAGDFNGDGLSDLLLQAQPVNTGDQNESAALTYPPNMNGVVLAQANRTQPFVLAGMQCWSRTEYGVDWSPLTSQLIMADFNGDHRLDVLLQPLISTGSPALLLGNASGSIFSLAAAPLPSDLTISADTVVLIAGKFGGGTSAGLLMQATSREGSNSIARNIAGGVHPKALALPTLAAGMVNTSGIGYPSTGSSSAPALATASTMTPMAGTVAPTSAGRTAGQFSITPTGAASYNIPLWTPPGARGVEPHLALHYVSGGPDGPMGPGWSLTGLSAIVRCGKTWASTGGTATTLGSPAGVTLTTSDDICLDGNRLRETSGNPLAAGSTYQTEIADFSLVTAYGTQGNGPQYFIVQGKDGHYYEYGNTTDSRIFGSGATTPYAWALNKVRDRQGNNMVVMYSGGATALTLVKIQYTATPGTGNAAPYEVDFNYVARIGGTTITKYVAGGAVSQANQLDNVNVLASGTTVRKYQLGYQASPTTNRPLLQTVQECGGSAGTDCIRPTTITYQSGGAGWSTTATSTGLTGQYGFIPIDLNGDGIPDALYGKLSGSNVLWYARIATSSGNYGPEIYTGASYPTNTSGLPPTVIPGKFTGQSATQFLSAVGGIWYVYTYNGSGFSSASTGVPVTRVGGPLPGAVVGEYFATDYDGDGLPDLVSVGSDTASLLVRKNTTAPGGPVAFASTPTTVYHFGGHIWPLLGGPLQSADFNGDGRADILVEVLAARGRSSAWQVWAVTSNGFGSAATATAIPGLGSTTGEVVAFTGDWNGDGCTDVLTTTAILVSNCAGGFSTLTPSLPSDAANATAIDWNGDGQTDMLYTSSGSWYVLPSTGSGLGTPQSIGISAPSTKGYFGMDANADGQIDFAYVDSSSSYAVSYLPHNGFRTPPDLANSITDGFGINFSPTYVPISLYNYTKYSDATFPEVDFQGPMYVVNQFSASDGTGGTYTNDFYYWGARLNLQGRGFEGFYEARQHDSRNGVYQYSYYKRNFPYIGVLFQHDTVASDGVTFIASTVNDTITSLTPGGLAGATACGTCYFPYISDSSVYNYEPTGSKKGGRNSEVSYTRTHYTYDSFGNLTDTKATTTDSDSAAPVSPFNGQSWVTEIANTITNDNSAANWCVGRPSTTTAQKTVPGQPAQTRTVGHTIDYVNCRATVETVEPNDTRLKVTTTFGFDPAACGNTSSVSVVGLDQNGVALAQRTTVTSYGTRCQMPESVTNALSQTTVTAYNYALGVPSSITDPNNIQTVAWTYDNFARKTKETRADGTYTTYSYSDCVSSSCWGVADLRFLAVSNLYSSAATLLRSEDKFYDGLDRLRYDEGHRVLGVWDIQILYYDNLGRKTEATLPYSSSSNGYHLYGYDVANRVTQDVLYNSSAGAYRTIGIGYKGQTTTITDPNGHTITKVTDVAGKTRQVTDDSSNNTVAGTTTYAFDPFGNLKTIVDADTITSSYSYNIRGFKTGSNDADAGTWAFVPDSLNELVSLTDAKGQVFSYGYDLLGRMTSRSEPEHPTQPTTWTYGTSAAAHEIGRLKSSSKADGYAESHTYDGIGRPQTTIYTEEGTYQFDYAYNNIGTPDTVTYPTSTSGVRFTLKYVYDAYGYLNQTKDNSAGTVFWTLNSANDSNLPTLETLGNGAQVASSYTPWTNEVTTRTEGTGGSTTNLQNLAYNWDLAGNLHQRIDNRQALTEQFSYDSMNRLLTSTLNGVPNLTMTYDAAGNINSKSDVSASPYVYDTAHKHAVKTAGSWSMTYDTNGNMITRAGGTITWKSYNLPDTINYNGNSSAFYYNPDLKRWRQIAVSSGITETTHYVGGMLEVVTRGSGTTEYRHQVPAGSSSVVYTRRTDGTTGTYYATSDHLGSSDLVMDSAANVLVRESFTPFGMRRGSAWNGSPTSGDYTAIGNSTRKGFTGHEMLDSVNLVHMNGRVYDPYLGRFISPDTVIQSLGASQSINPYAYAWNDPLKYIDPSGHSLLGDILGVLAAALIVIFAPELGLPLITSAEGALTAAVAGFVGGLVGAAISTGSLSAALTAGLIGAVVGAAFYGAGSFAQSAANGSKVWLYADGVLAHAAVGCGAAMLSGGNCGKGALSAAVAQAAGPWENSAAEWGGRGAGIAAAGIVGGVAARVTGASFSDGFSVGAAGYLFSQVGNALDQGRNAATASGSEVRPDLQALAENPVVAQGIDAAWSASNPDGPPDSRLEHGFWISSSDGTVSIQPFPISGATGSQMTPGPTPGTGLLGRIWNFFTGGVNTDAIAFFHTHPNPASEGWFTGPSPADVSFAQSRNLPGIIQSTDGMYYFGPPLKNH
jgi:RHS repeat-associated protein